jgi:dienelactone hydrolase
MIPKLILFLSFTLISPLVFSEVIETVVKIPVSVRNIYGGEFHQEIVVTVFRDSSSKPGPWLVLNHGRPSGGIAAMQKMGRQRYEKNSKYFVKKGFVVFIPTRVGYGPSGGPDVEYSGSCGSNNFADSINAAVTQTLAVIDYAKKAPFVDADRGLVAGQSFGGITAVATSTKTITGLRGIINFSGGSGGNPESRPHEPCGQKRLESLYADYGLTTKVPNLWLYSVNDKFWGESYPKQWFEAFKSGANHKFPLTKFESLPPYGDDGHSSFTGNPDAWEKKVSSFLTDLDF